MRKGIMILLIIGLDACAGLFAQSKEFTRQQDIVYGMTAGTALLMDIYRPIHANHTGVIVIPGSAFGCAYPDTYDTPQLKSDFDLDTAYMSRWTDTLLQQGYTLFIINHRMAPAFRYTDIIADCRRAVRFIRHHATEYKIDPGKIAAFGQSSGANLCALLGVSDDKTAGSETGVDALSSRVQAVVALAAPFDLTDYDYEEDDHINKDAISYILQCYLGEESRGDAGSDTRSQHLVDASPYFMVTKDDAPFFIVASDDDPLIPLRQGRKMYEKLLGEGVSQSQFFIKPREDHYPKPDMKAIDNWLKAVLK